MSRSRSNRRRSPRSAAASPRPARPERASNPSVTPSPGSGPDVAAKDWGWGSAVLIVVLGIAAYSNSFDGPFIFDDSGGIVENRSIRNLGNLWEVLRPRYSGATVAGRPLLNLSFAINYALHGMQVHGYHATNLAIHLGAGLALWGLALRTLRRDGWPPEVRRAAPYLALFIGLLWTLHPLQTESVTYMVQRAESLVGLFFLLTLLTFELSTTTAQHRRAWQAASLGCCFLGMCAKEVMAAAPLLVLLYDRTFVAGSFRAAWQERKRLHIGMFLMWIPLGLLVVGTGLRGGTVGIGDELRPLRYAATQCWAIVHYLKLSVWPRPLVLDYGEQLLPIGPWLLPYAAAIVALVGGTIWALVRRPKLGFLGAWFLLTLAPTSSIIPVLTQVMAEHRMYLPLAAVIALIVVGVFVLGRKALAPDADETDSADEWGMLTPQARAMFLGGAAVLAMAAQTYLRNFDYASEERIWQTALQHWPGNARAEYSLGRSLMERKQYEPALAHFNRALAGNPYSHDAWQNRGNVFKKLAEEEDVAARLAQQAPGQEKAAAKHQARRKELLAQALHDQNQAVALVEAWPHRAPDPTPFYNRGCVYTALDQPQQAIADYTRAIELKTELVGAYHNRAAAWKQLKQYDRALADYTQAMTMVDEPARSYSGRGEVYRDQGRHQEAIADFTQALQFQPDHTIARHARAESFVSLGRLSDAQADVEFLLSRGIKPNPELLEAVYGDQVEQKLQDFARRLQGPAGTGP